MTSKYSRDPQKDNPPEDPAVCACSLHCKISCPHMRKEMKESGELLAWCMLYFGYLPRDTKLLDCARVLFLRAAECRRQLFVTPERECCQALN